MDRRAPRLSALVVASAALAAAAVGRRLAAARRRHLESPEHAAASTQPTPAGRPGAGWPHAEEGYRRLVESIDQVVFALDRHGRCTFLNRAWRELTGQDVEAALGQPLASAIHPDDRHHLQELSGAVLAGRHPACRCEVRVHTSTGAARWVEVRLRPTVGGGGVIGLTGTMSDATARRAVQQELERARQVAEQASTAKSEFLRAMSHEMRTPLNGVLGMAELLAATPLDAQQARYLAAARASASHLGALVDDIIELSRMDMGSLQPDRSVFHLPDLIESTLETVRRDASSRQLRLSCTVAADVPMWVSGDAGRLRQVLVNLLVHAVKFTGAGGVHVQAAADVDLTTRQATLRLDVHDTGPAIPVEQIDRGSPFSPEDPASPPRQSGTGLGLTVCKRLVEVLQGSIAVHSARDGGARVSVTVPLEVPDVALVESHRAERPPALVPALAQPAAGATAPAHASRGDWSEPPRVLVADDHDINRMVVRELLTSMGCQVEVVADGATAFERALTRPFDAIIMDCQMPELDGVEATRRLRQAQAEGRVAGAPKIIALTAHATAEDRRACLDAGMDAYLTKPLRGTVLQRTLQRLLAGGEPRRDPEPRLSVTARPALRERVPDAEDIVDPEEVLLRCDRNADLGARMLQLFAESLPDELARLEAAAAADDIVALGAVTHKMRGAAATLAAVRLAGALTAVELFLKHGDGGPLADLLGDVRHETALFLGVVPQTCRRLAEAAPTPPS